MIQAAARPCALVAIIADCYPPVMSSVPSTIGGFCVTGAAVGAGVRTAVGMARDAHWRAGNGRRSGAYVVTGRALGVEIARIGNISVVIEILYCVGRLDVVTVVTGVLIAIIDVRGVAVYTHLGFVSNEGFLSLIHI